MSNDLKNVKVRVLACEVVQTIQNLAHDIPLIPGKETLVRIYLALEKPDKIDDSLLVNGKLLIEGTFIAPPKKGEHQESIEKSIIIDSLGTVELHQYRYPDEETPKGLLDTQQEFLNTLKGQKEVLNRLKELREFLSEQQQQALAELLEAQQKEPLKTQRKDLQLSLNFKLPVRYKDGKKEYVLKDKVVLTLEVLNPINSHDTVHVEGKRDLEVKFPGPNFAFRTHAIGLRYKSLDDDIYYVPSRVNFDYLRSFLTRAFPISELVWNETVVDADPVFEPPFRFSENESVQREWKKRINASHMQLMALRAKNIDANADTDLNADSIYNTHYYGMAFDPSFTFDGEASDVPSNPRPETVAVGQAETFSGYYGAHEIAHTLGRLHPGYPVGEQDEEVYYENGNRDQVPERGLISTKDNGHIGLDMGDAVNLMQALPWEEWHDVMTYEDNLWVSSYTYKGLVERIKQENRNTETGDEKDEKGGNDEDTDQIRVIGEYDLTRNSGNIRYVFPVKNRLDALEEASPGDNVRINARYGDLFKEYCVPPVGRKSSKLFRSYTSFQGTIPKYQKMKIKGEEFLYKLSDVQLRIKAEKPLLDTRHFQDVSSSEFPDLDDPPVRLARYAIDDDASAHFLTINIKIGEEPKEEQTKLITYTIQVRPLNSEDISGWLENHKQFIGKSIEDAKNIGRNLNPAEAINLGDVDNHLQDYGEKINNHLQDYEEKLESESSSVKQRGEKKQDRIWHTIAVEVKKPRNIYLDKELLDLRLDPMLFELDLTPFDLEGNDFGLGLANKLNLNPQSVRGPEQSILGFKLRVHASSGVDEHPYPDFENKIFIEKFSRNTDLKTESNLIEINTSDKNKIMKIIKGYQNS